MTYEEKFLEEYKPGDDFSFGSNTFGSWYKDGGIYVNSHNEEQYYFKNVEDFCSLWFDDIETIPHSYQTYIGDRTEKDWENNTVTLSDGKVVPDKGFCKDEDGDQVWSIIENKNQ